MKVIAVGLGSVENARRFSEVLEFPLDILYAGAHNMSLHFEFAS